MGQIHEEFPVEVRMRSALRETMTLLAVILGLILSVANSAFASANKRDFPYSTPADASPNVSPALPFGLNLGFAMADFTGDTHPDLATVELDRIDSTGAQYVIVVQLSEGGHQFLQLTAPFGGLLITPKDVTGDGTLDLIVRAATSRAPVGVFLNDGFGHFSPAAPAEFSQALRDVPHELGCATDQTDFSATLISSRSYTAECQSRATRNPDAQKVSLISPSRNAPAHPFLPCGWVRAPPTVA
jgi:hypothetical protein